MILLLSFWEEFIAALVTLHIKFNSQIKECYKLQEYGSPGKMLLLSLIMVFGKHNNHKTQHFDIICSTPRHLLPLIMVAYYRMQHG